MSNIQITGRRGGTTAVSDNTGANHTKSKSSDDSTWQGGPCQGPIDGYTWWEVLQARDRQVMEDGKRLQKYYEAREAKIEEERLAKIRERKEWEQKWLAWRFGEGPKPAPLE
jgi:hypothetical protein